jgi:hypothetical protein
LTLSGWSELRDLAPGRSVAVPRRDDFAAHVQAPDSRRVENVRSRAASATFAERADTEFLDAFRIGDILWDPITSVVRQGSESVYDLTVGDLHNFCVDDVVTHNSGAIEQEADIVTFLYRDVYYNKETSVEPDVTEFIIAKHRNGKVGTIKLRFQPEHTLFVPYGDDSHYPSP